MAADLAPEARMLIEHQCIQLNYAFARYIDNAQLEDLIDLFTEDCVFDRAGPVHRGHAELREGMAQRPPITTRHLMTNFWFDRVESDIATGVAVALTFHAHGPFEGTPLVYATTHGRMVEMHDEYRRTPAGWKFAKRIASPVFVPAVWP
ncbi:MAG: nuclear transport factor 2 family protein [Actinomycetota bacterium]|nr:nuclear transport factor 2 family protein [Actinomycetota bacterium]